MFQVLDLNEGRKFVVITIVVLASSASNAAKLSEVSESISKYGKSESTFSPSLVLSSSVKSQITSADKPTLVLSNDKSGLVNVARGKKAYLSSVMFGTAVPSRIVDGNVNGQWSSQSVGSTSDNDKNPWLEIDLGETENIDHIVIWNRTDCCSERLSNYWVFVSVVPFEPTQTVEILLRDQGIYAFKGEPANPSFAIKCVGVKGGFVRVQLASEEKSSKQRILSVAEVEVYRAR